MSTAEYSELTPAEFSACVKAWRIKVKREWANCASINVMLANIHRKKGAPAFSLDDFCGGDN